MIPIRRSPATSANDALTEVVARDGESNLAWLGRVGFDEGIILFGGSSLAHFRIRVAQSHVRSDMLPSFWSLVGVVDGDRTFASVPLELRGDISGVPVTNGIQSCRLKDYDDPKHFPNVGVIRFAKDHDPVRANIDAIRSGRSIVDLPSLMVAWLGFIWGAIGARNPLLEGSGLPCAAFAETVCGMAGLELTPGLSSASSCPEAIWQAAKWWHRFYEQAEESAGPDQAVPTVPSGAYVTRQPNAAVAVESVA